MQFRGVWRDYQVRVLDEMDGHMADGRLHVVAAPGAGKTVLGLEIVRRLGRPAVVFAPTVAIRDQWAERLVPLFLEAPPAADEVSQDLARAAPLTLATYQALDGYRRGEGLAALAEGLAARGPLTLVLDEAHHLRREWWASLEQLAASLPDVRLVSLTATPPYDAAFAEWTRYESLCGPIDLEIGIPELVRNGDLAAHQDHVVFSAPTADTLRLLDERRRALAALQRDLLADDALLDGLSQHRWLLAPETHVDAILEAPEMLSAVLVLLAAAGRRLPAAPLRLLGVSARDAPKIDFRWLERLLDGLVGARDATFRLAPERLKPLRERLHRQGLIVGDRVRLSHTRSVFQAMASSLGKLDSIVDIARAEHAALGADLRMVVLTDHVRAGELPAGPDAAFRPAKLGVAPIFEQLRRAGIAADHLGVLTGTLVILPRRALPALEALAAQHAGVGLRAFDLPASPDHVRVEATGAAGARIVPLVTALFVRGEVRILVGTQALLGEGWDAPALNSLVLASNTAAFMLCNQMRGRAIRVDPANPGKVANIWHLATVDPADSGVLADVAARLNWGELHDEGPEGLSDAALLARRFRAFEGVSNGDSTLIESGIGRLGLDAAEGPARANARALALAADRAAIAQKWAASLGEGDARARVRETAAPAYAPRRLAFADTLQAVVWSGLSSGAFVIADELRGYDSWEAVGAAGMAISGAAALASLPKLFKAGRLAWRNGSLEGSLGQVGHAVLDGLVHAGLARPDEGETAGIEVRTSLDGRRDVVVRGVSRPTERQVIQAISEVLGPVQNPRYLLVRESRLGWRSRADYHAVPAALGAKKEWAEAFARAWVARVGSSRLVFCRNPEGRRVLLRARARSLAAGLQRAVDRRSAWL